MGKLDVDHNGSITFEEFYPAFKNIIIKKWMSENRQKRYKLVSYLYFI